MESYDSLICKMYGERAAIAEDEDDIKAIQEKLVDIK